MGTKSIAKWQYGDFQTPLGLARKVVEVLKRNHGVGPDFVIEPTCGKGAFVLAACEGFENSTILGLKNPVNPEKILLILSYWCVAMSIQH